MSNYCPSANDADAEASIKTRFPSDTAAVVALPVMRPLLPKADALLPYLRRIDSTRTYSNFGPLLREFEAGIAARLQVEPEDVVAVSSNTDGLIAAILATAGAADASRALAMMPAFSFVATAVAAERCGYRPCLIEVEQQTWALDPDAVSRHPALSSAGVVIPVSPFGKPTSLPAWTDFARRTGVPVVIDAAAAFSVIERHPQPHLGALPSVFSFHATKGFGIGEGGCVVVTDRSKAEAIRRAINFGFQGSRHSVGPSLNGKLSEYHAAVGLAQLDAWPQRREAIVGRADAYRDRLNPLGLGDRFFGAPHIDGAYALFQATDPSQAEQLRTALTAASIGHRRWYGRGIHTHAQFARSPSEDFAVSRRLGEVLIGLPMAADLTDAEVDRVVAVLNAVCLDAGAATVRALPRGRKPSRLRDRNLSAVGEA